MKKICLLLMVSLSLAMVASVFADASVTHYIPELEVSVDIPVGISCISRESDETNVFYQTTNFDYATVHQYMLDNNIYLFGTTLDMMSEFSLIATDDDTDLNSMDSISLSVLINELKSMLATQGATDIYSDVYQGKKNKAIRMRGTFKTQQADRYVSTYYTTHGSKLLTIRFISFDSAVSDNQEKVIEDIFNSLVWEKRPYSSEPKGETDINIYSDYETGLTFMVPSGWNEVKFVAGNESKKVKYRIGTDNVWVLYESGDMWDTFVQSSGELIKTWGITRKDVGNTFLSKELIATQLGCSESDISMKTIGDQEYYCMNTANTYSAGAFSLDTQDIVYICMRDSYMYWFQLSGVGISKYEDQFNRFMKTVEFQ